MAWAIVGILVAFGGLVLRYGSVGATVAALRGQELVVDSPTKSFGSLRVGERTTVTFHLRNISNRPVRLLGYAADCGCTPPGSDRYPTVLGPGASKSIEVEVVPNRPEPRFHHRIVLYTGAASQPEFELFVDGVALAPSDEPASQRSS